MIFEKKKNETMPYTAYHQSSNESFMTTDGIEEVIDKKSLLLHSCCGPCSTSVLERLTDEFNVTVFFYNPCITDEDEYLRRRAAQIEYIERYNEEHLGDCKVSFYEGDYRPGTFFELTKGHEEDPEGGARCSICFKQRLDKTAETARLKGMDFFGTTLTVSPHKNYGLISDIGRGLALKYGVSFLDRDFKKKNGFGRSVELSKKYGLYRQNYCGCEYSKR